MINFVIIDKIKKDGFGRIYFPVDDSAQKTMTGFLNFLKEPLEFRKHWTFDIGNETEIGYLPRDKPTNKMTGYSYDHKDVFHFTPSLLRKIRERQVSLKNYEGWLINLYALYDQGIKIGHKISEEIEKMYPGLSIVSRVNKATQKRKHVLRLLHYHMKKREGGLIGLGHKDESFFTIHMADNFPGLKVGKENSTNLITTSHNTAIIYPGKKVEQITKNNICALWHEIVDTRSEIPDLDKATQNFDIHRLAIVFFLDIEL